MKVRISFELDFQPSDFAREEWPEDVATQFLSDWDLLWMVDEGHLSNAKAEVLEAA